MAAHRQTNHLAGETSPCLVQRQDSPAGGCRTRDSVIKEASPASTVLPRVSGVYQILCVPTGQIYIGSAVNLRERWNGHRRRLRRGTHGNSRLQRAWNVHGEDGFQFSVLKCVDASELLRVEQVWIDRSRCTDPRVGFNISDVAAWRGGMNAREWKGFVAPDGHEVTVVNLFAFCREHALDAASMMRLASGKAKLKSYKGWTHCNSPRKREYVKTYSGFIDPEGRSAGPITNLAAFCRERGLDNTHMVAVAQGRIYSHRGWTCDNDRQDLALLLRTHIGFISPEGQRVIIVNLREFCREHGLHPVRMHQVKSGKRKSHKGWTWRPTNESP